MDSILLIILFFVVVSQFLWLEVVPIWLRALILVAFGVYIVFFSGISMFIRPYLTNMDEWAMKDNKKYYGFSGTGVFINENDVMTNEHVTSLCKGGDVYIRTQDNVYSGRVVAEVERGNTGIFLGIGREQDEIGYDFSIITTNANNQNYAVVRRFHPTEGDIVISPDYTSKPGVFSKDKGKILEYSDFIRFDGPGRKGNSGSPIYNDRGYLVGVHHSGGSSSFNPFSTNVNYGTSIYNVVETLQKNKIKYYIEPENAESLMGTDRFEKSFAVGILCRR